jgi:hypothetical protein
MTIHSIQPETIHLLMTLLLSVAVKGDAVQLDLFILILKGSQEPVLAAE